MNSLTEIISGDIRKSGWISFERFMELALYCPHYGFYERESDKVGRGGDFYTSVSVGPMFGELLAFQLADWAGELRAPERGVQFVEAGANRGRLATDVLGWLRRWRQQIFDATEYWIIEPSAQLRALQAASLHDFAGKVKWFGSPTELPAAGVTGVMFSNELLDALPLRRLGWDRARGSWFEWGVTLEAGAFAWARGPACAVESVAAIPQPVADVLPDGYSIEVQSAACGWWSAAAARLRHGRLLAFDYGFLEDQWIIPERTGGTLRAYSKHRVSENVLNQPGEQDITAHVNFSAIQRAGEEQGLITEAFVSQERFLVGIAEQTWKGQGGFVEWDAARKRQFQTLVHPQHLGRAFRVLVQRRVPSQAPGSVPGAPSS